MSQRNCFAGRADGSIWS